MCVWVGSKGRTPLSGSWPSLWGQVASFDSRCNHWALQRQVGVPPLQEFTVCFYLKLEV